MLRKKFCYDDMEYIIADDCLALLCYVKEPIKDIKVPSVALSSEGKKYKIIGVSRGIEDYYHNENRPHTISFDNDSEIEVIYSAFFISLKVAVYLPPRIKRVIKDCESSFYFKIYFHCWKFFNKCFHILVPIIIMNAEKILFL